MIAGVEVDLLLLGESVIAPGRHLEQAAEWWYRAGLQTCELCDFFSRGEAEALDPFGTVPSATGQPQIGRQHDQEKVTQRGTAATNLCG